MAGGVTTQEPAGLHVTALTVYPVKSLAGIPLDEAWVETRGLHGDRRWAVVDREGVKVTAREEHALLGLRAEPLEGGGVRLVAPAAPRRVLRAGPRTSRGR
jgi:uncharacterized protein